MVHKVCDTISELASDLLDKHAWPEVLPQLQELIASNNPAAMEAALLIIANLASYSTDHLRPHLTGLIPVLGNCLAHSSTDVQVRRCSGSCPSVDCQVVAADVTRSGDVSQCSHCLYSVTRSCKFSLLRLAQIAVVAISGVARQGKSYILNRLVDTSGAFTVSDDMHSLQPYYRPIISRPLFVLVAGCRPACMLQLHQQSGRKQ